MENKVYAFMYCPCIHESAFSTVSLHKTQKGAEIAMEFHKQTAKEKYYRMYTKEELDDFGFSFGMFEAWEVVELEILD